MQRLGAALANPPKPEQKLTPVVAPDPDKPRPWVYWSVTPNGQRHERYTYCSECCKREPGRHGCPVDFQPSMAVPGGSLCESCGSRYRQRLEDARMSGG